MRWLIGTLITLTLVIIAAFTAGYWAENRTLQIFKTAGFKSLTYQDHRKTLSGVTFKNITLDEENISTIDQIIASYGLDGSASIIIENLNLTGDTLNKKIEFAGFENQNFPFSLTDINLANALIKNGQISLLTNSFGGLSLNIDGTLTKDKHALTLQSRFSSSQKQLSISGQATGTVTPEIWALEGEIEQAKFDIDAYQIKITRAQGQFSAQGSQNGEEGATIQITAGGFQFLDMPWKNMTATLDKTNNKTSLYLNAHALNAPQTELSIFWNIKNGEIESAETTLTSPDKETLKKFLQKYKKDKFVNSLKNSPETNDYITLNIPKSDIFGEK